MNHTPPLESVHPGQLEIGDIVHAHGMVLLVDRAPTLSTAHAGGRTFYTDALVTNRDEVSGDVVPYGFTERTPEGDRRRGIRPEHRVTRPEHRWTLQGNDGAFVAREIR